MMDFLMVVGLYVAVVGLPLVLIVAVIVLFWRFVASCTGGGQ